MSMKHRASCGVVGLEAFGKGGKFGLGAVGTPDDAAIVEDAEDDAAGAAAQGLDSLAGLEGGRLPEGFDDLDHRVAVEDAGHVVGDGGSDFPFAQGWKIAEERERNFPAVEGEGVAVEEEQGSVFVKLS